MQVLGIELDRAAQARGRVLSPTQGQQGDAAVGVGRGEVGAEGERLLEQGQGHLGLTDVAGDHPQQMQAVDVARIDLQRVTHSLLGLRDAAGREMLMGGVEHRRGQTELHR